MGVALQRLRAHADPVQCGSGEFQVLVRTLGPEVPERFEQDLGHGPARAERRRRILEDDLYATSRLTGFGLAHVCEGRAIQQNVPSVGFGHPGNQPGQGGFA